MKRLLRMALTAAVSAAVAALPSPALAQTVEYYHLDPLGSIRVVTDQNAAVLERHDYYPFGEECVTGACATNPGVGAGQPRKFTGKPRDVETGLDYFGARYYASKTGRFTTVDPVYTWQENLVDPQRWNRYAYVRNNPLRYVDPDGRAINVPLAAGGAAIGGILGFGGSAVSQLIATGSVNWTDAGAAGAGGIVAGAVAGFTFGLAPALAGSYAGVAAIGAGSNVVGGGVTRSLDSSTSTGAFDGKAALVDAGAGALGGAGGKLIASGTAAKAAALGTRSSAYAAAGDAQMARDAAKAGSAAAAAGATRETVVGTAITNAAVPIGISAAHKVRQAREQAEK